MIENELNGQIKIRTSLAKIHQSSPEIFEFKGATKSHYIYIYSMIFPLVVHQPASLFTIPGGDNVGAVEEMLCM